MRDCWQPRGLQPFWCAGCSLAPRYVGLIPPLLRVTTDSQFPLPRGDTAFRESTFWTYTFVPAAVRQKGESPCVAFTVSPGPGLSHSPCYLLPPLFPPKVKMRVLSVTKRKCTTIW